VCLTTKSDPTNWYRKIEAKLSCMMVKQERYSNRAKKAGQTKKKIPKPDGRGRGNKRGKNHLVAAAAAAAAAASAPAAPEATLSLSLVSGSALVGGYHADSRAVQTTLVTRTTFSWCRTGMYLKLSSWTGI
jgi:hypothetical protein